MLTDDDLRYRANVVFDIIRKKEPIFREAIAEDLIYCDDVPSSCVDKTLKYMRRNCIVKGKPIQDRIKVYPIGGSQGIFFGKSDEDYLRYYLTKRCSVDSLTKTIYPVKKYLLTKGFDVDEYVRIIMNGDVEKYISENSNWFLEDLSLDKLREIMVEVKKKNEKNE